MHRNPSVNPHEFAMIPRADIPRSSFRMQTSHKTTINGSGIYPIYVQEILPGDSFNLKMTAFSRMTTLIYPIMDNLHMESFFFFVPNRLLWTNWVKFMGEQLNPGDSISYTIPQIVSPVGGFGRNDIYDYMGLPCAPNLGANTISINALPLRAYNLILNQWFRDENLTNAYPYDMTDGPSLSTNFQIISRAKKHDYFTSCLPFVQKGTAVSIPLTGNATVRTSPTALLAGAASAASWLTTAGAIPAQNVAWSSNAAGIAGPGAAASVMGGVGVYPVNLYADLSTATATTINALRQSFQIQKLLERDARGGTRYTEIVRSHFGVISPDARLQRAEFLGGGQSPVHVMPIAQQSQTGLTGGTTPIGTLAGIGTNLATGHGFSQSFTEHGYVLGLINIRGDLNYQQGVRKLWSRSTRYDFFFPVFSMLGEQSVLNKEIYADGSANDALTFGYQERWAEYRYHPPLITGKFNSTAPTPLDAWHLAEKFTALPVLNSSFIVDPTVVTMQRIAALGASSVSQQFLVDMFFDVKAARPMPLYSVPGLIDHF